MTDSPGASGPVASCAAAPVDAVALRAQWHRARADQRVRPPGALVEDLDDAGSARHTLGPEVRRGEDGLLGPARVCATAAHHCRRVRHRTQAAAAARGSGCGCGTQLWPGGAASMLART